MNRAIITGEIKDIEYKLVDKGNVYALIIIKLKVEKCKKDILIIGKNKLADNVYREYNIYDKIIIDGYLRKIEDDIIIIFRDIEKI